MLPAQLGDLSHPDGIVLNARRGHREQLRLGTVREQEKPLVKVQL